MVMSLVRVPETKVLSLEEFLHHPPDNMEWVDGQLIEKTNSTFITREQHLLLTSGETVSTQKILPGFTVSFDELLA